MKASSVMRSISYFATLFLFLYSSSTTKASLIPKKEGIQTLVLVDDWATLESHSIFFDSLRKDGHKLIFESVSPAPQIKYYDDFFYDNIIMMAPASKGIQPYG
jgi:Oligosaccharyltransferase 48 kDa subunit beta